MLIDPGDQILVEKPTYLGALQAWNLYQARYLTVPNDDDGMRSDSLARILRENKVKFIAIKENINLNGNGKKDIQTTVMVGMFRR